MVLIPVILFLCYVNCVITDPCLTYEEFQVDYKRSPGHVATAYEDSLCDILFREKWYRFVGEADGDLTNDKESLMKNSCGTFYPLWMDGEIPDVAEGIVDRKVCTKSVFSSCHTSFTIQVKNCCSYRVYYLHSASICPSSYCVSPSLVPLVDCLNQSTNSTTSASSTTDRTTYGDTTSGISPTETFTTTQTTSEKTMTTPASERRSSPISIVLAVVCVVLLVLFIGLPFILYRRCKREKGLPDSGHLGNAAMDFSRDMNNAFTENTLNSHYEEMQANSQSDGEYQDINGSFVNHYHYPCTYPTTVSNNTYENSEKPNPENLTGGPYDVLTMSTGQSDRSPYETLKSLTSPNLYDILSQTAADSNTASNVA